MSTITATVPTAHSRQPKASASERSGLEGRRNASAVSSPRQITYTVVYTITHMMSTKCQ
jgi:hypothetical protein